MSENKKKRKQRNKEKPKKANKMKTAQHEEEEGSKRLPHSGPGDDSLLLAVRTGTFQDVERVLNSQEDGDVCSQAAVDQALCIASARGHVLYVTSLLAAGADVNWRDQENNTSLLLSAERRFVHIVRLLVGAGADINVRNSEGATPLMLAIHPSGSNDLARLLVNSSNVNIKDNSGRTALMKAIEAGDVDTIQLLLKSGASLKDCDNNGHTISDIAKNNGLDNYLSLFSDKVGIKLPLFKAVEMRNLTLIKNIITMNKQMVTQRNDKFETVLQHFLKTILEDGIKATTNDLSIIEYLLKAQRNIKNSKQKFTNSSSKNPVQLACLIGDDDILLLLLKYGAELDTNSYDDEDKPLMIAAKCGHAKILEILLAKGSKITAARCSWQ